MWITLICGNKNISYICPMKKQIINKDLFYNSNDVCSFVESLPTWTTDKQRTRLVKLFACYRPKNKK